MVRDNYKPDKRLGYDKKKYISEWHKDSNYFLEQNYYNWMANCLFENINPVKMLDIGCGSGNGIIELLKNENIENIISIEENEFCIDASIKNIEGKEISLKKIIRNKPAFSKEGMYVNEYSDIDDFELERVNIIQGDILHDQKIKEYIKRQKYDAITCWLLGTHESIQYNFDYINAGVQDTKTFRLLVQNFLYELADIILNENGFLHIVDRGEIPDNDETMAQYFACHKDQASVTSLKVEQIKYLRYEPIEDGIRMINSTYSDHDRKNTLNGTAFISVISRK
jgi:SAM-dependent methyltransferase